MRFPGKRARVSVVLGLVILLLLALPAADQFAFRYGWARQALEEIEARHARLLGLRDAAPRLAQTLSEINAALNRHTWPADTGADRIGADLQQRIRRIAEATAVSVVGSQILPSRPAAGLELIVMSATLDAEIGSLRDFLLALQAEQPSVQVDSLNVSVSRQRSAAAESKLRVTINVSAIHLLP